MVKIDSHSIYAALKERKSTRAYLGKQVSREVLERVLALAARAPSGNNNQPWQVSVVLGAAKDRLSSSILRFRDEAQAPATPEYDYYPEKWPEPHLTRRREVGWAMYNIIGVKRGDHAAAKRHHDRNFQFFGAPVGLIFSINRQLGDGAYIDVGIFMQALATAAMAEGLATCLQAAFAPYHAIIREELGIDANQKILCGMSLGYEDRDAAINGLKTARVPISDFTRFYDQ